MRPAAGVIRLAVASLLWLALFSLLFTIGSAVDLWPPAAPPRSGRLDLPVGLAFGVALGSTLLRRPAAEPPKPEA